MSRRRSTIVTNAISVDRGTEPWSGKPPGRKVAVHRFRENGMNIDVPIYMETLFRGTMFHARVNEHQIDISNRDVDAVHRQLNDELRAKLAITWTRWLYVTVEHRSSKVITESMLAFGYKPVELGTAGDRKVTRWGDVDNGDAVFQGHPRVGVVTRGDHRHGRGTWGTYEFPDHVNALVEDTPTNREALQAIVDGMEAMQARIAKLLAPEAITRTLAGIAARGIALLGTGTEGDKTR